MKVIDQEVVGQVLRTLEEGRLFRYDCECAEESVTSLFERHFAEYLGVKYAVAMNSCSSAIFTALVCSGVQPGAKVLIPAFTFTAVPSAIVHAGAQPVLVEMTDQFVIDCSDLERKMKTGAKVLLLSHMRGRVSDMDRIAQLCRKYEVFLIEDCAHSLGVLWDGVPTGMFGRVSAFSAQSYKVIDSGEGGILATNEKEIAFKAMLYAGCYESNWMKHFGVSGDEDELRRLVNTIPAYNFRMSNLCAAALLPQIEKIEARVDKYNQNFERFVDIVSKSPHTIVPKFLPKVRPAADSVQFQIKGIGSTGMQQFQCQLNNRGVKLSMLGLAEDNARCFWRWNYFDRKESCPFTKSLLTTTADMRLRLHLSPDEIDCQGNLIVSTLSGIAEQESANSKIQIAHSN